MRYYYKFLFSIVIIFIIDQYIKYIFVSGFRWNSMSLSLILVYNKGIAFSMFAFLEGYLKYLQLIFLFIVGYFFYKDNILLKYPIVSGILIGAGISNIFDRFIHIGVVDYIYYHGIFNFAVFNFADIMIDLSIAILMWFYLKDINAKNSN